MNKQWIVTTFIAALQATAQGSYVILDANVNEVKELKKLRYVSAKPSLHKQGSETAFVAQEGAYVVDLINDLSLNLEDYILQIPTELRKMSNSENTNVPAVPQIAADDAAPAAPHVELATLDAAPAAPQFHEQQTPVTQLENAVVDNGVIGATPYAVVNTVERDGKAIEIEVGIPFVKPSANRSKVAAGERAEAQPYKEIVEYKVANPTTTPSFHLSGRKTKDVSGLIRRHALKYEESHGVTFRASTAHADDPKGEGVRVTALFVSEAPPRPVRKKKDDAAPVENEQTA